jgi:hypothetical protein
MDSLKANVAASVRRHVMRDVCNELASVTGEEMEVEPHVVSDLITQLRIRPKGDGERWPSTGPRYFEVTVKECL